MILVYISILYVGGQKSSGSDKEGSVVTLLVHVLTKMFDSAIDNQ